MTNPFVLLVWAGIALFSTGAAWWAGHERRHVLLTQMTDRAQNCAVAFATEDTAQLHGTPSDLDTPAYRTVKARLMRLRSVAPGVRFVYLFRSTDQAGRVVFLADSEPENSNELSKPGDDYPEALQSPGLQEILRTHRPSTEGPLRDSFGEWVTAYAPVGDRPAPGAPRIIFGLDVDSASWSNDVLFVRVSVFALVLLALGVPFALWISRERERGFTREIRRLSAAIQQSDSAVLITNAERVIEYVNDGCTAMTGYRHEELVGQPTRMLLPDDFDEAHRQQLLRDLFSSQRWRGELPFRRRNGEIFPVRAAMSPVRGGDGRFMGLVAVIEDITAEKRAESELRVARDQAEAADRAKGEFLAMMSHELRTPLNGIIGFATLLRDTPLTAEQTDYVETVRKSGDALLTLTNELLDYSRIDAGRMKLDPQTCSPRQIVEEAVELLSTRAADKHLELLVALSPRVPAQVLADPGRLRQVLVNLIGNAIKFTSVGEVEIEVDAQPVPGAEGADPQVRIDFVVRDTGIGIDADKQDRLFKPFSQVDTSSTRRYGGAGLGLAISRSLVRLMGGDITVHSASGAGAEFSFHILAPVLEQYSRLVQLPSRRVAVVSPNARARRHYVALLAEWGLQVSDFENVSTLPDAFSCDVVLVDIRGADARNWLQWLETRPVFRRVPVIGVASVNVTATVRDDLRVRLRALLKKPLRESLFHAVLTSVLTD